jgi:hypothetical protein
MLGTKLLRGDWPWRGVIRRLAALARATAVLALVIATCAACLLRSAEARAGEALLGFGRELAAWTDAHRQSETRVLSVNGLQLELMTVTTSLDVKHALDHFHDLCRKRGGVREPAPQRARSFDGVLRKEAEHEGVLACIDTDGPLGVADLTGRLERFSKSGNLAELGKLRYVLARRSGETTTLLALWTDRDAQLLGLMPASGDATGKDPNDFPRATGLRRLLSAAEQGAPYTLTVYEAGKRPPDGIIAWYQAELTRGGWSVSRTGDRLLAHKASRSVVLGVSALKTGKTAVSIAELS